MKVIILPLTLCLLVLLSGCWDQRLFKDAKLVLGASFDLTDNGKLLTTVSIPNISKTSQGPGRETVQIISAVANTPRESREKINHKISKNFDASKMRVLLLGKKLAKQKVYPLLDVFYRDPTSALNAKLAVVNGKSKNALNLTLSGETKVSTYLSDLLDSARKTTLVGENENIQGICGKMLDPGSDIVLPLLEVKEQQGLIKVAGLALFNGDKYTGYHLTPKESTLFLLLSGQKGDLARITAKVFKNRKPDIYNYITIEAKHINPDIQVNVNAQGEISAALHLNLKVRTIEYPKDKLNTEKEIRVLDQKLSKVLTKLANDVAEKLQKANADPLGIGRQIIAFHHDLWDKIDWSKEYPNIQMNAEVNVEILQHGIIN
ncbi:MAG TPA: Ger(x)C family spore germination protein [Bacillales bacterium]|nr:Ger(x)C family spore germination protein [Bacillales bacterium]